MSQFLSDVQRLLILLLVLLWVNVLPLGSKAQNATATAGQMVSNPQGQTTAEKMSATTIVSQPIDRGGYVLGPGDRLSVRIFGADDIPDRPIEVGSDGKVNLPMVGMVQASGVSVRSLENDLTKQYGKYFKDPEASVSVTDYRSQPVTVSGEVNTPNIIQLHGPTRLMDVISQAGGLRPDAGDSVMIMRQASLDKDKENAGAAKPEDPNAKFHTQEVDLLKIINGTDPSANVLIEANDLITVPKARMVYVVGDVNRPGGFVLDGHNNSIAVLQAIALAGGLNRTASAANAKILRSANDGDTHRMESRVNLNKIMANKSPDITLHADDILFVPNSSAKNASVRALEMAVNVGTGIAIWRF